MKKEKGVSAVDFFCIGFGAIVGVGWAVSINSWMNSSGGPLPAAAGYMVAMILMVPIALCYCELCTMLPVSGGGMAYAFRAFGDRIAFISGWAAFGAFITIIPWEAIYVVDILSIVFPILKAGIPLYTLAGADIYIGHIILGTAISILLYMINRKGVASSATLQKVLCMALVGAGILAMICAAMKFNVHNLEPFYENTGVGSHHSFLGGMASILASVPFFLAGFETIPQGIESAGGDTKGVGKTVVITVVLSCLFYALLLFTLGGALPWKEFIQFSNPSAARMFRTLYPGSVGNILYVTILIGAICGLLTTWNGFMMASSQILMAMARVSIVPFSLSRQHPDIRHGQCIKSQSGSIVDGSISRKWSDWCVDKFFSSRICRKLDDYGILPDHSQKERAGIEETVSDSGWASYGMVRGNLHDRFIYFAVYTGTAGVYGRRGDSHIRSMDAGWRRIISEGLQSEKRIFYTYQSSIFICEYVRIEFNDHNAGLCRQF